MKRFNTRSLLPYVVAASLLMSGCTKSESSKQSASTTTDTTSFSTPCFVEISDEVGVRFTHDVGEPGDYRMPQIMGSGAILFDFDNDNDLDILLISGVSRKDGDKSKGSRLFRQDAIGRFTDVTAESGIVDDGYGMGGAVGDIDNDGDLDLYLTRYGDDRLYRNVGGGKFEDITVAAGIANPQWATAASFFDYDRDGWLDLFVVNYVDFFPGSVCEDGSGQRDFCGPDSLAGVADRLYRNLGRSNDPSASSSQNENLPIKFEDVTIASGIANSNGKGLGVLCRDFDGDGLSDILVANDADENYLWVQHENGLFSNEALLRGLATNRMGELEGNMGVVADDFDNDGLCDVFITHLRDESNTLFNGAQYGQFSDQTLKYGYSISNLPFTGFGVTSDDFDNDGDMDLAMVNGAVNRGPKSDRQDVSEFWQPYAERNEFYLNNGHGRLEPHIGLGGSDFAKRVEVSRALASGDVDNDGDIDLLVSNCAGPARLYRNDFPKTGDWLMVAAIDAELHRVAIGAKIQVLVGQKVYSRDLNPSSSYLSCNDMRVHFGLGKNNRYDAIRVTWPSGSLAVEEFPGGSSNNSITLVRGTGKIVSGSVP